MMKIGIQTWGSDGDILPFFALAGGLQAAGHEVTVAYTSVDNKDYTSVAERMGCKSFKAFDKFEMGMDQAMEEIVQTTDPLKQIILVMERYFDPAIDEMWKASKQLCEKNDLVIGHMMNHTLLTAAEKFEIPRVVVALAPLAIRTKYIPLFGPNLGSFLNKLTWSLGDYVGVKKLFLRGNEIRQSEGLPAIKSLQKELYISKDLTLIASSPSISIRQKDWEDNIHICGDLYVKIQNTQASIAADMKVFLTSGLPPIYITFGSLAPFDAQAMMKLTLKAVKVSGCRAIIQADWSEPELGKESDNIFLCRKSPHVDVFPYCATIIHHGGAGTTHSALRAGCSSIVVEHAFDQTFWGNELRRLGVAGELLHRRTLTAEGLAKAIETTLDDKDMKVNAVAFSEVMKHEDGVKKAVELITNMAEKIVEIPISDPTS